MLINSVNTKKRESDLKEKPFPFEVVHVGEPVNNMDMFHWHEFMEISYIQDGNGIYEVEDKAFSAQKGDIVIINDIERHRVTYKAEEPLYETVIHFEPRLIWSRENSPFDYTYLRLFLYNGTNFSNKPQLSEKTKGTITSLISEIVEEYTHRKPYFELMIKSRLLTLITILIRQCDVKADDAYGFIAKRNNIDRLDKILRYINENFNKDISLEIVAKRFFMNSSYFSDFFKRNIGINFSEYLARLRISEAIRLLDETGDNSIQIAYACGFNNTSSFYNAFKKITGMNPGEYKRSREV